MQISSEHIAAITIPTAIAICVSAGAWAAVQGCKEMEHKELERVKMGMVEVYDPVANRTVWRHATNTTMMR